MIQLGHNGPTCPCPGPIQENFVVIDLSGIHTINIRYCACHNTSRSAASHIQLLRFHCFLSTITRPQSAFTFDDLNTFHLLTLQGKLSVYEFYCALQHKMDNTSISGVKVRFDRHWCDSRSDQSIAILSTISYHHLPVAASQTTQTIGSQTWSCRHQGNPARTVCHGMSGLSPSRSQHSTRLDQRVR